MEESDVLTAVSNNLKEETYKNFTIQKPIEVIYNFVDVKRFNKKPIEAFKKMIAPGNEKILVHASNFRKVKRVMDVVKVFLMLNKKIPCKLLLIGDGPDRSEIEAFARESNYVNDIKFLGKQEQMEDLLPLADLFLLTSDYESFGLSALEAMAAEVPVISTNAGGLPEININGYTGYLCEIGDIEGMSEKAFEILSNPSIHNQFKKNALAEAQKFDINIIVPQYETLYFNLLNKLK
jgi:glycosyltransferase involved in cell wall biosynthesis